ncbi:putative f-box domain-protein [Podospora conica]|nr:putative f-box domain-protein [Schizothecium conicum]
METVGSLDVRAGRVAVAARTEVVVFEVPVEGDGEEEVEVRPSLVYDLGEKMVGGSRRGLQRPQVCRATWMSDGMMALALKSVDDPLRYLEVTPTGWTHYTAVKNPRLEKEFGIEYGNLCPSSLTPVQPLASSRGGTSLLLSAWRDGSIRLQDLRTPSPVDMVYEDNIDPWSDMETLMTYGTERFIGGGMDGATIKIFDFRWSKGYQHTMALPCSGAEPLPRPPQPFIVRPTTVGERRQPIETCGKRCDHVRGTYCLWHGLSRDIYYRPNASFFLSSNLPAPQNRGSGVWALAKGSDVSPNFYIGIAGGVIEAALDPSGEGESTHTDPHFGFSDWRDRDAVGAGYRSVPLGVSMMETGDGMLQTRNDRAVFLPPLLGADSYFTDSYSAVRDVESEKRFRLDPRFYGSSIAQTDTSVY